MSLCDCLEKFRNACDELLRLSVEESSLLRASKSTDDAFANRKRHALRALESALDHLKAAERKVQPEERTKARALKADAQQKVMRLMLLDRENEQLLLRTSFRSRPIVALPAPTPARVRKAYKKAAATK